MRKLGLIGGTGPQSTLVYYRELLYSVKEQSGFLPPLTIESLSVFSVLDYCRREDYEGLASYLLEGVKNLTQAGCEAAAFTGITPHIVLDKVQKESPIPLISMIAAASEAAAAEGLERVAILGTGPTMEGSFFREPFNKLCIETVIPEEAERKYIAEKIEAELENGNVLPETRQGFLEITDRLVREDKAEAIVLGCTELPLLFDGLSLEVPALDVMRLHIRALASYILTA